MCDHVVVLNDPLRKLARAVAGRPAWIEVEEIPHRLVLVQRRGVKLILTFSDREAERG